MAEPKVNYTIIAILLVLVITGIIFLAKSSEVEQPQDCPTTDTISVDSIITLDTAGVDTILLND